MHDNKLSLWLEDAIAAGAFLLFIATAPLAVFNLDEPQPQAQAPVVRDCIVTISQYGPGERWYRSSSFEPACAGAVVPAPNHILTHPLQDAK